MKVCKQTHYIAARVLIAAFILSSTGPSPSLMAQMSAPSRADLVFPKPGVVVQLSPAFTPALLKGMTIHAKQPLQFDFLIQQGDEKFTPAQKQDIYARLIKYFMASLTIPDQDQWVNLSPYEHQRIINANFGSTEMGRDLLSQDYLLKQITSSLMYPESGLGGKFWDKVYRQAWERFHTNSIPVNTFNKVWIVPDEAVIYENGDTAYILKSHLKVMLEEDYLAAIKGTSPFITASPMVQKRETSPLLMQGMIRQIILPALEQEVNQGKNFALLRQIVSGMVLASWYKKALKESILGKVYADKSKTSNLNADSLTLNTRQIYQQYLKAFKKGVYNYIKEDEDKYSHQRIPRKYFAGGFAHDFDVRDIKGPQDPRNLAMMSQAIAKDIQQGMDRASVNLKSDAAMIHPSTLFRHFLQSLSDLGIPYEFEFESILVKIKGGLRVQLLIEPDMLKRKKELAVQAVNLINVKKRQAMESVVLHTYRFLVYPQIQQAMEQDIEEFVGFLRQDQFDEYSLLEDVYAKQNFEYNADVIDAVNQIKAKVLAVYQYHKNADFKVEAYIITNQETMFRSFPFPNPVSDPEKFLIRDAVINDVAYFLEKVKAASGRYSEIVRTMDKLQRETGVRFPKELRQSRAEVVERLQARRTAETGPDYRMFQLRNPLIESGPFESGDAFHEAVTSLLPPRLPKYRREDFRRALGSALLMDLEIFAAFPDSFSRADHGMNSRYEDMTEIRNAMGHDQRTLANLNVIYSAPQIYREDEAMLSPEEMKEFNLQDQPALTQDSTGRFIKLDFNDLGLVKIYLSGKIFYGHHQAPVPLSPTTRSTQDMQIVDRGNAVFSRIVSRDQQSDVIRFWNSAKKKFEHALNLQFFSLDDPPRPFEGKILLRFSDGVIRTVALEKGIYVPISENTRGLTNGYILDDQGRMVNVRAIDHNTAEIYDKNEEFPIGVRLFCFLKILRAMIMDADLAGMFYPVLKNWGSRYLVFNDYNKLLSALQIFYHQMVEQMPFGKINFKVYPPGRMTGTVAPFVLEQGIQEIYDDPQIFFETQLKPRVQAYIQEHSFNPHSTYSISVETQDNQITFGFTIHDPAMLPDTAEKGGIDLNSSRMAMKIRHGDQAMVLKYSPQDLARYSRMDGLVPQITRIETVKSLPILDYLRRSLIRRGV